MILSDFFGYEKSLKKYIKAMKNSDFINEENKRLILEFDEHCASGSFGKQLKTAGRRSQLQSLYNFMKFWPYDVEFHYAQARHFDEALIKIQKHFEKVRKERKARGLDEKISGDWAVYHFKVNIRKFMRWLRAKYWYPEDYPGKESLDSIKYFLVTGFSKKRNPLYPQEVAHISVETPNSDVKRRNLPSFDEIGEIWDKLASVANAKYRALFKLQKLKGPRIGGIGSLLYEDVEEIDLGFKFYIRDKNKEKVIATLIVSAVDDVEAYEAIKAYILEREIFLKSLGYNPDDPKLPFWLKNRKNAPAAIEYTDVRNAMRHYKTKWNRLHPEDQITKRIYTHLARFFAEGRDQLNGVPDNVRRAERGWSPKSVMPSKYGSRITDKEVENYHRKRVGLIEEKKKRGVKCIRCGFVNNAELEKCVRCDTWLDPKKLLEVEKLQSARISSMERRLELIEKALKEFMG